MLVEGIEVLLGADPEIFVTKKNRKTFVSAHNLIPGTKADPYKVDNGAVQVDGMALEFNIDPAATEDEFVANIKSVMAQMAAMVPDYDLHLVPTASFSKAEFARQPKEALELGCEPDYNAYTGEENIKPDANANFRTASGHIHIGWTKGMDINDKDHKEACFSLVRELDVLLGLASLEWDSDNKRRELYGAAGSCRIKSYGVEYRPLSNRWLSDEVLMRFVYKTVIRTFRNLINQNSTYTHGTSYKRVKEMIKLGLPTIATRRVANMFDQHNHFAQLRKYLNKF